MAAWACWGTKCEIAARVMVNWLGQLQIPMGVIIPALPFNPILELISNKLNSKYLFYLILNLIIDSQWGRVVHRLSREGVVGVLAEFLSIENRVYFDQVWKL
jgi:hypothetical protein